AAHGADERVVDGSPRQNPIGAPAWKNVGAGDARALPIRTQCLEKSRTEHHVALSTALGVADVQQHPLRIDIFDAKTAELPDAEAGPVGEHHDGTMSLALEGSEDPLDLDAGEHGRDAHRDAHMGDLLDGLGPLEGDAVQEAERADVHVERPRTHAAPCEM